MAVQPSPVNLPFRAASSIGSDHRIKSAEIKGVASKVSNDCNTQSTYYFPYIRPNPHSPLFPCDDPADWVIVRANNAPSSKCSDDVHTDELTKELTTSNVLLLDTLNNGSPALCAADGNGTRRRCHRRCPRCRKGSVKTHASTSTHNSYLDEIAQHIGPWSPANLYPYDTDVFAVGAWAVESDGATAAAYTYPTIL